MNTSIHLISTHITLSDYHLFFYDATLKGKHTDDTVTIWHHSHHPWSYLIVIINHPHHPSSSPITPHLHYTSSQRPRDIPLGRWCAVCSSIRAATPCGAVTEVRIHLARSIDWLIEWLMTRLVVYDPLSSKLHLSIYHDHACIHSHWCQARVQHVGISCPRPDSCHGHRRNHHEVHQ